jgi:Family of unknown function (DUF6262)
MSEQTRQRVERACTELVADGEPITFTAVAARAGVGRATLYRNPTLRALVEEHRARTREAHTLSGLAAEVAQLRTGLEAVAARVRHHDQQLRRLTAKPTQPRSTRPD